MRHFVGVSGGKDSTCLALRLQEVHPDINFEYLITPVGNELPDMFDHWARLETLLGKPFIRLQPFGDGDGLAAVIAKNGGALPNHRMRFCTRELKILPTIQFLSANAPCVQYVGLRADEEERVGIYGDIPGVEQRFPLREWGYGVEDVWRYLSGHGIIIPRRTDCALCYGQRLIEWKRLLEDHPEEYQRGVDLEAATGHTFRSAKRDTWPAGLAELRDEFQSGRAVRGEKKLRDKIQLEMFQEIDDGSGPCRVCSL